MKYLPILFLILVFVMLSLTGCNTIANYYDSQDPCLQAAINHTAAPSFCSASERIVIYNPDGTPLGYIKKAP